MVPLRYVAEEDCASKLFTDTGEREGTGAKPPQINYVRPFSYYGIGAFRLYARRTRGAQAIAQSRHFAPDAHTHRGFQRWQF